MDRMLQNQQWADRVADFQASGQTMLAWCSAHNLTIHQLKYWLRKFKNTASSRPNSAPASPQWATLAVVPSDAAPIIVQVGHARIEIRERFDPAQLRMLVQTLAGLC